MAVGPVRGFALALGTATLLDLAFTIALTWPVATLIARSQMLGRGRFIGMTSALEGGSKPGLMRQLYRSEFAIDFIGRRRLWAIISGIVIFISLLAMIPGIRGLQFGIDFRGGTIYRVPMETDTTVGEIRSEISGFAEGAPVVQILTDQRTGERQAQVQTEEMNPQQREELAGALASAVGSDANEVNVEAVGEKWGQQITVRSLRGLAIFLGLVIIYLTLRLEFKMAASALVALLHDLAITAGVYALVGFEVTPATVIATLTIMGYSLYDTVVVFDKIKENMTLPANSRKGFGQIVNESVNKMFMRSINTSITTLIPVGSLLFVGSVLLGADTLRDLALALFVGIAASTYSSVFVAAPLLSVWKEGETRYSSIREKVISGRTAAKPASDKGPSEEEVEIPALEEARPASGAERQVRPGRRPQQKRVSRAKRKKKGRR